tara:strand:- start:66 stop:515 length:450 start_codon:yes stop_codon:yes gene_type:complete
MIAELAAANAAFSVIKTTISHGGDLARCAKQFGALVGAKETLQKKVANKKATHQSNDFEEFMALERIREQEAELKQIMIYVGRPGLLADWQVFEREARKARRKAEADAVIKKQKITEYIIAGIASLIIILVVVGFFWWALWYKGIVKWP